VTLLLGRLCVVIGEAACAREPAQVAVCSSVSASLHLKTRRSSTRRSALQPSSSNAAGIFTKEIIDDLQILFANASRDFEAEPLEFDGEDDVHLLVSYPSEIAVPALANNSECVESDNPAAELPDHAYPCWF
jgi:hypothetical protein